MPNAIITLTTDFGTGSPYVAQMKGVILSINAAAHPIDITHAVPPQDVRQGALILADVTRRFPAGSIHVGVVDPGVGTSRRIVCAEINRQLYVAPNNGLLSYLSRNTAPTQVVEIANTEYWLREISRTFHGRDIMAPVAAHLSLGTAPAALGPTADDLLQLDWPTAVVAEHGLSGTVISVDSFGNLITNIEFEALATAIDDLDSVRVQCGTHEIAGIRETYAQQPAGALVALFGSSSRLEIAVVNGNAARQTGIGVGQSVTVSERTKA